MTHSATVVDAVTMLSMFSVSSDADAKSLSSPLSFTGEKDADVRDIMTMPTDEIEADFTQSLKEFRTEAPSPMSNFATMFSKGIQQGVRLFLCLLSPVHI